MRRRIGALAILTITLGVSVGHGEWRMRVHHVGGVDEFATSEVDSVTFYQAVVPPMVTVPAGVFLMGDGVAPCGVDVHQVTLTRAFRLGEHEVTNEEYMEALQWAFDHGHVTADSDSVQDNLDGSTETLLRMANPYCEIQFSNGTFFLRESPSLEAQQAYPQGYNPARHPVKMGTWYGAARWCDWKSLQTGLPRAYQHQGNWDCNGGNPYGAQGYRLVTEAEWEYAAQFDDERIYPWGNEDPDCSRANYGIDSQTTCVGWSRPVGSYADAPAALGLKDLAGNSGEMTNDWFECELGTGPRTDPVGPPTGTERVIRGGGFLAPPLLRCAARGSLRSADCYSLICFRAARTVTP